MLKFSVFEISPEMERAVEEEEPEEDTCLHTGNLAVETCCWEIGSLCRILGGNENSTN